jgi:2-methylcitrate dehydratase PrpD
MTSATRELARYVRGIQLVDVPQTVVHQAKLVVIDVLGNSIGGSALPLADAFVALADHVGGGRQAARVIGDGRWLSTPMAAFANAALATMLDYADLHFTDSGRRYSWLGALAVPAALVCGEANRITGAEFLASVVAGYEGGARVVHSMDSTLEQEEMINGATYSLFAAVTAAGRSLALNEDEMLSAIGMAGIYTPVAAGYKWMGDEGLTPRKDIKQGWAWQCHLAVFAAESARAGLRMLQPNNILDGDHGLWSMLGMDVFRPERLVEDMGDRYYLQEFMSKALPGCAVTHAAMAAVTGLVHDNGIDIDRIDRIDVSTNRWEGIGFDDPDPIGLSDRQFSMPYQVAAALVGGEAGPNWYQDELAADPRLIRLTRSVHLSFDDESDSIRRQGLKWMCKVRVQTADGTTFHRQIEDGDRVRTADEVRAKFRRTVLQVTTSERVEEILNAIDGIENMTDLDPLLHLVTLLPDPEGPAKTNARASL